MFSGWLKDSELLKCHNPVSKNHKTENPSIFVCPDGVADEEIEERDVNARKAWYRYLGLYAQVSANNLKEIYLMKNIEMTVEGETLIIKVDLSKDFGPSKSGKTIIVASTEGNVPVLERDEKIGLNVYRYPEWALFSLSPKTKRHYSKVNHAKIRYKLGTMETISIKFDKPGMEISTSNREELARIIDDALQDSGCGRWAGCRYTKDTITIFAMVEDKEHARSVIRPAICLGLMDRVDATGCKPLWHHLIHKFVCPRHNRRGL